MTESNRSAVVRLSVNEFRCYSSLRVEVDPRPVVLTGPNGAGKTNILEALSFLAPGRGLRRCRLGDVARIGSAQPAWAVAASVKRGPETIELGTGRDGSSERRLVRIEGRPAKSQTTLGEWLSVLWLVPAMDRLFTDSAGGRRRFLDRLVLGMDPGHARRSSTYDHALRERGRLVREGRRDARWFEALEQTLAEQGSAIAEARRAVVERLNEACGQGIGPFPAAQLGLSGTADEVLAERGQEGLRDWLRDRFARAREDEAPGPHRSDFLVRHRGKDLAAAHCSTGEQKALLLSILLGQARVQTERRGVPPVLLLDEVAAHLDETRRAALWDELEALRLQSWMTGTDFSLFADLEGRGQFFGVADGQVAPLRQ